MATAVVINKMRIYDPPCVAVVRKWPSEEDVVRARRLAMASAAAPLNFHMSAT